MPTLCGAIVADRQFPLDGNIAIVAERRLSAAALLALLLANSKYRLVDEAQGTAGVTGMIETHGPAIIVIDSAWSGRPSARDLIPTGSGCRVLALLGPDDDPTVFARAAKARVQGFVSRGASGAILDGALTSLRSGGYLDPMLAAQLRLATSPEGPLSAGQPLSPREHQVLVGIASGQSTKEVAREYAIAAKTVANHVNNIQQKLKLSHRGQLVMYAAQHGLTSL